MRKELGAPSSAFPHFIPSHPPGCRGWPGRLRASPTPSLHPVPLPYPQPPLPYQASPAPPPSPGLPSMFSNASRKKNGRLPSASSGRPPPSLPPSSALAVGAGETSHSAAAAPPPPAASSSSSASSFSSSSAAAYATYTHYSYLCAPPDGTWVNLQNGIELQRCVGG